MNHDEHCEEILKDADLDELALLKDTEPITPERLVAEDWRIYSCLAAKQWNDNSGTSIELVIDHRDGRISLAPVGKLCLLFGLPNKIKTMGQLRCLIIGLGGDL